MLLLISTDAVQRLNKPRKIQTNYLIQMSIVSFLVNLVSLYLFHGVNEHDHSHNSHNHNSHNHTNTCKQKVKSNLSKSKLSECLSANDTLQNSTKQETFAKVCGISNKGQ